jgi:hypothetical protein
MTTSSTSSGTIVARTLERDLGVSLREAITNAGQTGAEEQMDQVVEMAKAISNGQIATPAARLAAKA